MASKPMAEVQTLKQEEEEEEEQEEEEEFAPAESRFETEPEEEDEGEEEEEEEEAGEEDADEDDEPEAVGERAVQEPAAPAAPAGASPTADKQRVSGGEGPSTSTTTAAAPNPSSAAAAAAEPTAAGASTAADSMDLKQLEVQASKVAQEVQHAAMEMSNKLTASFKSALGGLGTSEPPTLSKLAGGLASWWSSLDPPAAPKRDEMAERVQASSKATSELQELFGLGPEENLVESFKCKLLQTYACNHNAFTPAIQMAFQGTLYITDRHTCFSVEERNRKMPFKVPHSQISKAERHRPPRKGDLSDILRIELKPSSAASEAPFLSFKDFDSGSALDSALALVEHLMDG